MNLLRAVVSGPRRRFQRDGFNLDLSYITPRIIAMGFPAESVLEAAYRNPIDEVSRFLHRYHDGKFMVFNLAEKHYEGQWFDHMVLEFPWPDHHSPPLSTLFNVCWSIRSWLSGDPANVAVVHCIAGKGRTGTVIACALMIEAIAANADEAMRMFSLERAADRKGVTNPCQVRYVHYMDRYLGGFTPPMRPLRLVRVEISGLQQQVAYAATAAATAATAALMSSSSAASSPLAAAAATQTMQRSTSGDGVYLDEVRPVGSGRSGAMARSPEEARAQEEAHRSALRASAGTGPRPPPGPPPLHATLAAGLGGGMLPAHTLVEMNAVASAHGHGQHGGGASAASSAPISSQGVPAVSASVPPPSSSSSSSSAASSGPSRSVMLASVPSLVPIIRVFHENTRPMFICWRSRRYEDRVQAMRGRFMFYPRQLVFGDIMMRVLQEGTDRYMFRLAFHTGFVPDDMRLVFHKRDLDDAYNDKKMSPSVRVELFFEPVSDEEWQDSVGGEKAYKRQVDTAAAAIESWTQVRAYHHRKVAERHSPNVGFVDHAQMHGIGGRAMSEEEQMAAAIAASAVSAAAAARSGVPIGDSARVPGATLERGAHAAAGQVPGASPAPGEVGLIARAVDDLSVALPPVRANAKWVNGGTSGGAASAGAAVAEYDGADETVNNEIDGDDDDNDDDDDDDDVDGDGDEEENDIEESSALHAAEAAAGAAQWVEIRTDGDMVDGSVTPGSPSLVGSAPQVPPGSSALSAGSGVEILRSGTPNGSLLAVSLLDESRVRYVPGSTPGTSPRGGSPARSGRASPLIGAATSLRVSDVFGSPVLHSSPSSVDAAVAASLASLGTADHTDDTVALDAIPAPGSAPGDPTAAAIRARSRTVGE